MKPIHQMKIKAVFDNLGQTVDRYTVVFNTKHQDESKFMFDCVGLSSNPTDPQGFSQWDIVHPAWIKQSKRFKVKFETLPKNVQKHVKKLIGE